MSDLRCLEFKIQSVNQVAERKLPLAEVAARVGVSTHRLARCCKNPGRFSYRLAGAQNAFKLLP